MNGKTGPVSRVFQLAQRLARSRQAGLDADIALTAATSFGERWRLVRVQHTLRRLHQALLAEAWAVGPVRQVKATAAALRALRRAS